MAQIVYDDFEGRGTNPTSDVTTATHNTNTYATNSSGTSANLVFSTSAAMDGTLGLKLTTAATLRYLVYTITATPIVWITFKLKMTAYPGASVRIATMHGASGASRNSELAVGTTGILTVNDGSAGATSCTSSALSLNTEYRVAYGVNATSGYVYLNVYEGDSLTAWSTDEDLTVTMTATSTDTVRFGGYQSSTWDSAYFDELHIHSDTAWAPAAGTDGIADYQLTQNYAANSNTVSSLVVDATGSTGTTTLVQTSGTTASKTESPTGVFTITNPSGTDDLVFTLTAAGDGGGADDTATVTWVRSTGGTTTTVYFTSFVKTSDSPSTWLPALP